ncbi:MAG: hypothetical protein K2G13_02400, partial [Muribaculaceae bacterium]|nr:hypothetical protein [Muribaculaceae bacterium]
YGYYYLDINDCGCFGGIKILNTNYFIFIIRNLALIIFLLCIHVFNNNNIVISPSLYALSLILISISYLMCENAFKSNNKYNVSNLEKTSIQDHVIGKYVNLSKDSTYMITIFSYDCPHCINSIGNLVQFNKTDYVDKIVGLCIQNDAKKKDFYRFFKPTFTIIEFPENTINEITSEYPVTFFIKNDTIVYKLTGEIPSGFFFKDIQL